MNLKNFKRQHEDIYKEISDIKSLLNINGDNKYRDLAYKINELAGKLKVHLTSEDKFLYPSLLSNDAYKEKAELYISEMGNLLEVFTQYKLKYNTKNKIEVNIETFKIDSEKIIDAISNRMDTEENDLYLLID